MRKPYSPLFVRKDLTYFLSIHSRLEVHWSLSKSLRDTRVDGVLYKIVQ